MKSALVAVAISRVAFAGDGNGIGALADKPPVSDPNDALRPFEHVAIAINEPFGWTQGTLAASAYVALTAHQVLRANVEYDHHMSSADVFALGLLDAAAGGDAEYPRSGIGGTHDYGLAWMWFPRHVYSGVSIEAGVLLRLRDYSDNTDQVTDALDTTTIAMRVMLGYSWRFGPRFFASAAVGLSIGRQYGTETMTSTDPNEPSSHASRVPTRDTMPEAFVRIGVLLGPS
jgi:hypothetical protein